ncbi:hypothetical protein [Marinomonas ostreistagni]|uniref:Uncharacterized protein n=1 Tax=Marinomonas ostreistagni TaxID=359209 RepID=A0ABS0ZD95_9GAMM|nr:hypothetical protein [Marinomonas ostreistagni]MBJ7551621.1 hypothetical protein [Marinomonas ostreistagni]
MIRTILSSVAILSVTTSQLVAKELHLGYETFCLPSHYDTLDLTKGSLFTMIGLDDEPHRGSFQFFIPAVEVKQAIKSYNAKNGEFEANLKVNVMMSNSFEQERVTSPNYHADVLRLSESYSEASIEHDEELGVYRVSSFSSPPPFIIWHTLSQQPFLTRAIPDKLDDYYLGYCSSSQAVPGGSSGTSCDYNIADGDFLIEVGTSEENLLLQNELTSFVKRRLNELKHEC